ncbi:MULTISPECIES: hypothetical protein [Thalassospira]|uniref:Flagellar protein n=2 Tax=Thalassospira TaxID=168934 RepID=A0AB72UG94_9PROT|nr:MULTISPECIES: hypothetical protein [Thalassospira]AJD53306.1 hypothetical protein TH3_16010 [Thalassospira xiamenensis M-5 = DSM 17429]KEO51650.1 hypothetical protein SMB34_21815 [Thalassospira permensis NBRC 106175]SIT26061.1 hypothetical protein SAMN02744133_1111 [Thalassospira xiamenensis M-5 = DSM 17429]
MNSLLGLGFGLPVTSPKTSVSKDGGPEGIDKYSAFSATPQSSKSAQPTFYGTKFGDLSDSVQAVMLEMQATGSGSTSFADAMANVAEQGKDATSGEEASKGVFSSNSDPAKNDPAFAEQDAEEEFKSAVRDSLTPPSKEDKRNETAEIEARKESQEIDIAAQQAANDLPENVAGLDSRVAAQVMSGRPGQTQPALAA